MIAQNKKGFSLIEILIYTGLFTIVGALLSGILISVTRLGNQQSASTEVNQQLNFVLQTVQRLVRDSSLVDIPSGTATSLLVLKMKSAPEDPTKIYLSGNKIYLQQGTEGTPSPLINDQVLANNITFVKISSYPGHDSVQVDLTLSYNTQNPQESFTKSLSSAVARVSAATFDSSVIPGTTNNYDIGLSATRWKNLYLSGSIKFPDDTIQTTAAVIPVGTVQAYAGITAPSGWLEANGAAISRATYSNLFAVIGTSFGYGDQSTTFNLPDLRGEFVRGWDHGAGRDPDAASRTAAATGGAIGNNVGSQQTDSFKSHTHPVQTSSSVWTPGSNGYAFAPNGEQITGATGGNETRPKNINLMYIIKY